MTKDELVAQVAGELDFAEDDVLAVIDELALGVGTALAGGDRVTLGPLGVFSTRQEGAHEVHVPGQEDPVAVPAQTRVLFHASPSLRETVNAGGE